MAQIMGMGMTVMNQGEPGGRLQHVEPHLQVVEVPKFEHEICAYRNTSLKTNMTSRNITIFNRIYIFKWLVFQPVMFVFRGVNH